jgi:hypothetical protein
MKRLKHAPMMSVLILSLMGTFWPMAWAGESAPEKINCDAEIAWDVVKEAKLTQFDCALGESGGQPALIFTVGLENASDKPQRYRVNTFLEDMDKGFGHLVPRKGNPPLLEPGKSEIVKIPFIGTDKESKKILVIVKTISVD